MAVKVLTPVKVKYNEIKKVAGESASSASDGFKLTMPDADESVFLVAENTHSATAYKVIVKAPTNSGYAATDEDLELELSAGEKAIIRIESARFANTDGTVKVVVGNTAVTVAAVY